MAAARRNDGSTRSLRGDQLELGEFLKHQPDPNFPIFQDSSDTQDILGQEWGLVTRVVLSNVHTDTFLLEFPGPDTKEYGDNLEELRFKCHYNNITHNGVPIEDIGLFWCTTHRCSTTSIPSNDPCHSRFDHPIIQAAASCIHGGRQFYVSCWNRGMAVEI